MSEPSFDGMSALDAAHAAQAYAENTADRLIDSERRYRRLFETARDGILILDSEFGRITDANPFMTELLGYSYAELLGKELWEIGLLRDKAASQEAFLHLQSDRYIRYENLPLENRQGERRDVEFVCNLYREDGHMVIQCNIRDITERKRVERELALVAVKNERIAETLQRSMLQVFPTNKFSQIEVETLYVAALNEAEVGGDFFDAFAMTPTKIALVVGDVSGKGLAAAGRTAEVKYALRSFLHAYGSPEAALTRLNKFIFDTHDLDQDNSEAFIVLAMAVLDTVSGEAIFASAGAEPTLILHANGQAEKVETIGSVLGVDSQATYITQNLFLMPGETILMATDGITEARHGSAFLGVDGMAALAESAGPLVSLAEMNRAVYRGALSFAKGNLRDDVCVLVARRQ